MEGTLENGGKWREEKRRVVEGIRRWREQYKIMEAIESDGGNDAN